MDGCDPVVFMILCASVAFVVILTAMDPSLRTRSPRPTHSPKALSLDGAGAVAAATLSGLSSSPR